MGLSHSWMAVKASSRTAALEALGFLETGDEADLSALFAGAELATGWYVIRSRDVEFATPKRLSQVSAASGVGLAGQVEEHVMVSSLRRFDDGDETWWVIHEPEKGIFDLSFGGAPPKLLSEIRERLVAVQQSEGGEEANVDFIFEVPVQLGVALCGYRVDGGDGSEEPEFTELQPPRRPSLLARLFARA